MSREWQTVCRVAVKSLKERTGAGGNGACLCAHGRRKGSTGKCFLETNPEKLKPPGARRKSIVGVGILSPNA